MADSGVVFTVDGKRLELNIEEITGREAKEFRAQTGMAFRRAVTMLAESSDDLDIDVVAGIIWLARRQGGEQVAYDAVLGEINYTTDIAPVSGEVPAPPEV